MLGAAASLPLVWLAFGDIRLAVAVSLSIVAAGYAGHYRRIAPAVAAGETRTRSAFGSGPIATIIQDVLSLLIYFGIATLLLM